MPAVPPIPPQFAVPPTPPQFTAKAVEHADDLPHFLVTDSGDIDYPVLVIDKVEYILEE